MNLFIIKKQVLIQSQYHPETYGQLKKAATALCGWAPNKEAWASLIPIQNWMVN